MVHNLHHRRSAWPSWPRPFDLLKHGFITFLGMVYYGAPGGVLIAYGQRSDNRWAMALGGLLSLAAILAIPGYMSHYCRAYDPAEIFNPFRALRRATQSGRAYWHAWGIALLALALSLLGLLAFGVGFLITSVWFWQVAGFSFATVFTQEFRLDERSEQW